jgi:hypothetical protein
LKTNQIKCPLSLDWLLFLAIEKNYLPVSKVETFLKKSLQISTMELESLKKKKITHTNNSEFHHTYQFTNMNYICHYCDSSLNFPILIIIEKDKKCHFSCFELSSKFIFFNLIIFLEEKKDYNSISYHLSIPLHELSRKIIHKQKIKSINGNFYFYF